MCNPWSLIAFLPSSTCSNAGLMVFPDLAENLTVSGLQVQAAPKTQLSLLLQSSLFSWLLLSGTFLQILPKLPDPGFPSITFLASISLHKVSISSSHVSVYYTLRRL